MSVDNCEICVPENSCSVPGCPNEVVGCTHFLEHTSIEVRLLYANRANAIKALRTIGTIIGSIPAELNLTDDLGACASPYEICRPAVVEKVIEIVTPVTDYGIFVCVFELVSHVSELHSRILLIALLVAGCNHPHLSPRMLPPT